MSSILSNYEYDIFISYRQNDNKRDKWVTNFVGALKEELEATLKNSVSIYFDENPHDGLLETHQVNASLASKLKCIVFMPIISQTYCDETGYAWAHEFLPFLDMASSDSLGMNIKLTSGNVASRVLPIQIHDLDSDDQSTLEEKLNGPLRCVDFIYKEPGVNRPLIPTDDKNDNKNKTDYRNQLNKVANALKEIGVALLKAETKKEPSIAKEVSLTSHKTKKSTNKFVVLVSIVMVALVSFLIYMFWNGKSSEVRDKSIAVLPFTKANSGDEIDALAFGIHDDLLTKLSKFKELQVTSRTSVMEYENTKSKISEIANELGVSYILEGSIQQSKNRFRLNIQLIDGITDDHLWAEIFDLELTTDNIFQIQSEVAENIAAEMKMNLADSESNSDTEPPTKSIEALQLYNQAELLILSNEMESINKIKQALIIDPEFHKARFQLIRYLTFYFKNNPDSLSFKKLAHEELNTLKMDSNDPHLKLMAQAYYDYYALGDFMSANEQFLKGDQDNIEVVRALSYIARRLDDWDTYFDLSENIVLKKDPRNPFVLRDLSISLISVNKYDRSLAYIERALEFGDQPINKELKFYILVSVICKQHEAQRFFNEEKDNLNLKQLTLWKYWLDFYNRDYASIIDSEYQVPKGMNIDNDSFSNLLPLPSDLFVAQAYWLMGNRLKAKEQVELHAQHLLDFHDFDHCSIGHGNDFYGNEAGLHISRGYALVFAEQLDEAVREAEHAMMLYPVTKDGSGGRDVQDLAFRLIAISGNAEKTLILADKLLGSISGISLEMIKNDPIFDRYRELDAYKKLIAKYE